MLLFSICYSHNRIRVDGFDWEAFNSFDGFPEHIFALMDGNDFSLHTCLCDVCLKVQFITYLNEILVQSNGEN